jgi:APA family basic amino acid/polyamine antiporter
VNPDSLPHTTAYFDLVAFLAIAGVTLVLVIGIKESANLNSAIVMVKVSIVLVFIGVAAVYFFQNPSHFFAN